MDALAHVVRIFPDESVPHIQGNIDPQRDISSVELDLILADLGVVENRLNKLAKERKKIKNAAMEKEMELLERARQWLETEKPLREVEWSEEEKKQLRGFLFLSEKPMLLVINAGEDSGERDGRGAAFNRFGPTGPASQQQGHGGFGKSGSGTGGDAGAGGG